MGYCGPRGIPYTTFIEWDTLSRDAAVAWAAREASKCGACGEARGDWIDGDGIAYRVPPKLIVPVYCPSCDLLDQWNSAEHDPGHHPMFMPRSDAETVLRAAASREEQP